MNNRAFFFPLLRKRGRGKIATHLARIDALIFQRGLNERRCRREHSEREIAARLGRSQHGVKRRHHLCALADGSSDAFDRSGSDIADGKHAGQARLQWLAVLRRIGSGQHESLGVQRHT